MSPDLSQASRLITLLAAAHGSELETFQTFDDTDAKRGTLAQVMVGSFDKYAGQLQSLNEQGAGCFITVNATDGGGRLAKNVSHIRSLFADLDGAPLAPVLDCGVEPHVIVESSPDRWHAYWLIEPVAADAQAFKRWQKSIAARFDADGSVCDLPRVMRLPGFLHRKGMPFQTRITHESGAPPYDISYLVQRLALDAPAMPLERFTDAPVTTGRHGDLLTLTGRLARAGLSTAAMHAAVNTEQAQGRWTREMDRGEVTRAIEGAVAKFSPTPKDEPRSIEAFDLSKATVGEFLDETPPIREWLIDKVLPLGCVGLLAAGGGTGKSMLVTQLAVSAATGLPWLEMEMGSVGAVLIVSAEDDREEAHRRLHRIVSVYREAFAQSDDWTRADEWSRYDELLRERLFILDRVGEDNRLTTEIDRVMMRTEITERVIRTAAQLSGPVLIVLDPLSRFDGGDGNDNADATRLVECAEAIRKATGATVILPHHVAKGSLRDPQSGQEAVRGASGLVDGVRWVGLMQNMRAENAESLGIDPSEAGQYVHFSIPKSNYAPPFSPMWLKRVSGGVLSPTNLTARDVPAEKQARKSDDRYTELLPKMVALVKKKQDEGDPLTKRALRDFGGTGGTFGVGETVLTAALNRAIEQGALHVHVGGRFQTLHTWPQSAPSVVWCENENHTTPTHHTNESEAAPAFQDVSGAKPKPHQHTTETHIERGFDWCGDVPPKGGVVHTTPLPLGAQKVAP